MSSIIIYAYVFNSNAFVLLCSYCWKSLLLQWSWFTSLPTAIVIIHNYFKLWANLFIWGFFVDCYLCDVMLYSTCFLWGMLSSTVSSDSGANATSAARHAGPAETWGSGGLIYSPLGKREISSLGYSSLGIPGRTAALPGIKQHQR